MVTHPIRFNYDFISIYLGPKGRQGYMRSSLISLIGIYQRTGYLFLFILSFNPYNIIALFYSAPMYGNSYIFPNLVNRVGVSLWILVHVCFIISHW